MDGLIRESEDEDISGMFKKKKLPAFLGGRNFVEWVKKTFYSEKQNCSIPDSHVLAPEISRIKQIVCDYYEMDPAKILNTRRGKSNEPRDIAIFLARKLRRDTLPTIGNAFGMSGYSSVSSVIERVRKRLSNDKELKKRKDDICRIIVKGQTET